MEASKNCGWFICCTSSIEPFVWISYPYLPHSKGQFCNTPPNRNICSFKTDRPSANVTIDVLPSRRALCTNTKSHGRVSLAAAGGVWVASGGSSCLCFPKHNLLLSTKYSSVIRPHVYWECWHPAGIIFHCLKVNLQLQSQYFLTCYATELLSWAICVWHVLFLVPSLYLPISNSPTKLCLMENYPQLFSSSNNYLQI